MYCVHVHCTCLHTPNSHCGPELHLNNPIYDDNILVEQPVADSKVFTNDKITLSNITKEPGHTKTLTTLYREDRKGLMIGYSQSARHTA